MAEGTSASWEWTTSTWQHPDINWKNVQFITVGIDVGSISSQACVMADGEIFAYGSLRTGYNSADSAQKVLNSALKGTDLPQDRLDYCVGTGYGRVRVPFADRTVTEIACLARGANFLYGPGVRTLLDVGGQDIKAIQCDEKGKVTHFLMNDKCAAGTGRGMEVFADLLGISVNEVGKRSFLVKREPEALSETCVVYAKSEALQLRNAGWSPEEVLAAYCRSMAEQIFALLERLKVVPQFAVTGGMAKNYGVMDRLMPLLQLERAHTQWDPQLAGAVGAALFAHALCMKGKRRKKR